MIKKSKRITTLGFIFSLLGSCIGLGSIWRFPYLLSTQGGGAFLITFLIAILLVGIPFFILETSLGGKFKISPIKIWQKITNSKKYRIIGWISMVVLMIILIYYGIIFVWTINSFFDAFNPNIWIKSFEHMKNGSGSGFAPIKTHINGFSDLGHFNIVWFIMVILVWLICIVIVWRGITNSVQKINKITIPIKLIVILFLFIYCLTLKGSIGGINYLFHVDTSKLAKISTWNSAFSQVFFSSSIAIGILFAFGRKTKNDQEIIISSALIIFLNGFVAIIIAIIVYSILGWYAHELGNKYSLAYLMNGGGPNDPAYVQYFKNNISGPGLLFNLIPVVLGDLNLIHLWFGSIIGILFFGATLLATLTCFIASITSISNNFINTFKHLPKWVSYFLTAFPTFLFSIFLCFKNSATIIGNIDHFNQVYFYILIGFLELLVFGWITKKEMRFAVYEHCNKNSAISIKKKGLDFFYRYIIITIVLVVFLLGIINDFTPNNFFVNTCNNNKLSFFMAISFGMILPIIQIIFYDYFIPELNKYFY